LLLIPALSTLILVVTFHKATNPVYHNACERTKL